MLLCLHAKSEFNAETFVFTVGVQEGNVGQNQQNLDEFSPVLFHPHLFMVRENSWIQTNPHPSSRKRRSRSVVGTFKGLFFSVVLEFNSSWDFLDR